jgi:hypothetical protein
MTFTPLFASDTTAAFLSILVKVFFIGMVGGTLPALIAVGLYFLSRGRSRWWIIGVVLSSYSILAGLAGFLFVIGTVQMPFLFWVAVLAPLSMGTAGVIMWIRSRHEKAVG